jgi:hypothetical protein
MKVKIFNAYDLVIFETWIEIQVSGSDIRIKFPCVSVCERLLRDENLISPVEIFNNDNDGLNVVMDTDWSSVISLFLAGEIAEFYEVEVLMERGEDSQWHWKIYG